MTRLELFVRKWQDGCGSSECSRKNTTKCFSRGDIPCDILFIGEAPGESENAHKQCFIGPAGHLQDTITRRAVLGEYKVAYTNIVGCIPRDESGDKLKEPEDEQIIKCGPRLQEFVKLCNPRLIVCVGKLSREWCGEDSIGMKRPIKLTNQKGEPIPSISITHPSAIIRANIAQRGLMIQRNIVDIQDGIDTYLKG